MNLSTFGLVSALITFCYCYKEYENITSGFNEQEDLSTVLSRKKRFVIFPDGSSFQLVFCTQNHGYLQIGDIVWFGNTAALAWELPSDPAVFNIFKEKTKGYGGNRRIDKNIYYLNEDGKVIGKVPYKRRLIVNPAFAKRSVDFKRSAPLSKKKMHDMQKGTNYLNGLHEKSIEFHRTGRKSLYGKVEKVLQALGWNGTECVLRMLCESGKESKKQGTFLDEILRATFTLPKGREFADQFRRYDVAHGARDCSISYPGCDTLYNLNLYDITNDVTS